MLLKITIYEVIAMSGNIFIVDGLVSHLSVFELSNFDNSVLRLGNYFNTSLSIGSSKKENRSRDERVLESEDDMDDMEALLAKRSSRGKGNLPLISFKCNELCHITIRFPNKRE